MLKELWEKITGKQRLKPGELLRWKNMTHKGAHLVTDSKADLLWFSDIMCGVIIDINPTWIRLANHEGSSDGAHYFEVMLTMNDGTMLLGKMKIKTLLLGKQPNPIPAMKV
jgi:hypothetical protein